MCIRDRPSTLSPPLAPYACGTPHNWPPYPCVKTAMSIIIFTHRTYYNISSSDNRLPKWHTHSVRNLGFVFNNILTYYSRSNFNSVDILFATLKCSWTLFILSVFTSISKQPVPSPPLLFILNVTSILQSSKLSNTSTPTDSELSSYRWVTGHKLSHITLISDP